VESLNILLLIPVQLNFGHLGQSIWVEISKREEGEGGEDDGSRETDAGAGELGGDNGESR